MVIFSQSAAVLLRGEGLENLASPSPICSPFLRGPDLSVAPRFINHYPARVAPTGHIRPRINASGGGDLVNSTAATTGHIGLAGRLRPRFGPKQWEINQINQTANSNLLTPTTAYL